MPEAAIEADVFVLGAGPAGSCAALNLAPLHRTVLVDRAAAGGGRLVESLPGVAGRLLADMGLLESFLAQGHGRWQVKRSVWEGPEAVDVDLLRDPDGLGWHLDRRRFGAWLRDVAVERGTRLIEGAPLEAACRDGDGWRVVLPSATVRARVVIDAGGRAAPLAARLGARRRRTDRLVCGWVEGVDHGPHRRRSPGVTYLEAVEDGWWYTAGLPDGRRLVAFHTDGDLGSATVAKDGATLLSSVPPGVRGLLEDAGFVPGPAHGLDSAHSAVLEPCTGPGWAAVGDAALSFDPVSSQGLLNALVTGLAAAEATDRHLSGAGDAFTAYESMVAAAWHRYQEQLQASYGAAGRRRPSPFWDRRRAGETESDYPMHVVRDHCH